MITMPDMAYVSIFTDNYLTHITEDHFEIKLIARLLDQMYVVHDRTLTELTITMDKIIKMNEIWSSEILLCVDCG